LTMPVTSGVLPRCECLISSPFFRSSNNISFIGPPLKLKSYPTSSQSCCQACCSLVAGSFLFFFWPSKLRCFLNACVYLTRDPLSLISLNIIADLGSSLAKYQSRQNPISHPYLTPDPAPPSRD